MAWIEEDRARVLGLFDEQSRSLRRLVTFFLVPTLLFGILIFLPFTQQSTSSTRLQAQLDSARVLLSAKVDSVARIAAVDSLAEALRLGIRLRRDLEMRQQLWGFLEGRAEPRPEIVQAWAAGQASIDLRQSPGWVVGFPANHGASECIFLDDARWRECFPVALGESLCTGRGCLIYPDGRAYIAGGPAGELDEALALELLDSLEVIQQAVREEIQPLVRLVQGPGVALDEGYRRTREAFEGVRNRIRDREREVRSEVERLASDSTALRAELETANRLMEAIETSGNSFETPIGPLPVGIRELVLLYPTILGLAYLLCLTGFLRLVSLRRGYHELMRSLVAGPLSVEARHLTLTTPLWYDPLRPPLLQVGRALLAVAPLLFTVWSYLALRSGLLDLVPASESRFGQGWYEVSLLLTLVAVAATLAWVVHDLMEYRKWALAEPVPSEE